VTARIDVERSYQTVALDAAVGRIAPLQRPPREGPESVPNPPFHCERRVRFTAGSWSYASRDSSASASAISGISGVGAKPSSAGARTACAPVGRPVD
jgi:hypothetical protein